MKKNDFNFKISINKIKENHSKNTNNVKNDSLSTSSVSSLNDSSSSYSPSSSEVEMITFEVIQNHCRVFLMEQLDDNLILIEKKKNRIKKKKQNDTIKYLFTSIDPNLYILNVDHPLYGIVYQDREYQQMREQMIVEIETFKFPPLN
jgi:hypothetical protein